MSERWSKYVRGDVINGSEESEKGVVVSGGKVKVGVDLGKGKYMSAEKETVKKEKKKVEV